MGLAGTKRKQRLVGSATTRNASWLNDESLPGQRLMAQMGWTQGQGIGLSSASEARTENIKAMFKMDNKGIGAQRAEREARASGQAGIAGADKWIGGGGELGGLFERLNASAQATPTAELSEAEAESDTKQAKSDKKRKRDEDKEMRREEKRKSKKEKKHSAKDDGEEDKPRKSKSRSRSKATDEDEKKQRKSKSKEEKKERKSKDHKSRSQTRTQSPRSSSSEKEVEESTTAQALSTDPSASSSAAAAAVIRNASRAKYLRAKRQLYGDAASMNEILGIKSESNGGTPDVAATDVESALASAVESQQQEASSSTITPSMPLTAKQLKKLDKKKDKEAAKAEKKKEKKEKKKAEKSEEDERKRKAITTDEQPPAEEEPQPVLNTVSPYSVHEYLSRRLMLKKAQAQKKSRLDKDVWNRLCGGQVPRTAAASTGTLVDP